MIWNDFAKKSLNTKGWYIFEYKLEKRARELIYNRGKMFLFQTVEYWGSKANVTMYSYFYLHMYCVIIVTTFYHRHWSLVLRKQKGYHPVRWTSWLHSLAGPKVRLFIPNLCHTICSRKPVLCGHPVSMPTTYVPDWTYWTDHEWNQILKVLCAYFMGAAIETFILLSSSMLVILNVDDL